MKRKIFTLMTLLSLCCLTACATETKDNVATNNKNDIAVESIDNEPTAKPVVEATVEPTEEPSSEVVATAEPTKEPMAEATPEPTEEPVLYPGIDMESELKGKEWIGTFEGIITEPKVVIFNDETGRKEIVEEGSTVTFNPDKDTFALYLPEGWKDANKSMGLRISLSEPTDFGKIFELDAEKTRESKFKEIEVYTKNDNNEEKVIGFTMKTE